MQRSRIPSTLERGISLGRRKGWNGKKAESVDLEWRRFALAFGSGVEVQGWQRQKADVSVMSSLRLVFPPSLCSNFT